MTVVLALLGDLVCCMAWQNLWMTYGLQINVIAVYKWHCGLCAHVYGHVSCTVLDRALETKQFRLGVKQQ